MLNVLLFVGNYLICVVYSFTRHPAWAFILYQIVYFMYPRGRFWGYMIPAMSYSFYTVIVMIIVLLKSFGGSHSNKLFAVPQFKWIFLLGLGCIIVNYYAVYPELHYKISTNFIKLIIIISIAYKLIDTEKMFDYVLYAYIFGSWYIGFQAFQVGRNSGNRVEGIGTTDMPDTNGIATAIAPAAILAVYYFWISKSLKMRGLMAIAGVFILNAIVLINSRGAFLALGVGILSLIGRMYFSKHQRPHQKLSVIILVVFGLSAVVYLVDDSAIERFYTLEHYEVEHRDENQEASRTLFWATAIKIAEDHPLGLGWKGFDYYAPDYLPDVKVSQDGNRNRSVHSTWFQALTEWGYLGITVFIVMLISCFRALRRCRQVLVERNDIDNYFKMVALESGFLAYIVGMTFINLLTSEVLYWQVLYSACAYNIFVVLAEKENIE